MGPADTSLQLLACRYLRKQTKRLLAQIDGVRSGDDVEYVHQARVASRRIRTAIGLFEGILPPKKSRRWNRHIRRLARGLGAARDKDVQIALVAEVVASREQEQRRDLPGLERLLLRLRQERQAIQPRVIKTLDRLDGAGVLADMLGEAARCTVPLRDSGEGPRTPSVLEQGARDILETCDRLLRLQSCLEDAEAIQQHHQMRIAAKRLRYTMEVYTSVFDNRLDEVLQVIRVIQTLLGDIHDCDVWVDVIEQFVREEQQRTADYFGDPRYFRELSAGVEYLRNERITHRRNTFDELVTLWKGLQDRGFWEGLVSKLKTPPDSPPAFAAAAETSLAHGTQHPEDSAPPGPNPSDHASPDRLAVPHAPSPKITGCQCCGQNNLRRDALFRIDSGQWLCPGCLAAFREKLGET